MNLTIENTKTDIDIIYEEDITPAGPIAQMDDSLNAKTVGEEVDDIDIDQLPENVTEEPQNPEHMDLRGVPGYRSWLNGYLKVSDDEGDLLGDPEIEKEAQELCNWLKAADLALEEDPAQLISEITNLMNRYMPLVNSAENTCIGIITKYRIRQGMLLLAQKKLVRKHIGPDWLGWFKTQYDIRMLRSAQDYMRIAEVPNVIRYAVFGKERLIQIIKQIGKVTTEDPIADFLRQHQIPFDPASETEQEEVRVQTDIAVARSLLNSKGLQAVPHEKVEAFIRGGHQFKSALIGQLKLAMETGSGLDQYMDRVISSGGKPEPATKAESYKKTLARFLNLTEEAIKDPQYIGEVTYAEYQQLKEKVLALEAKFQQ